MYLDTRLNFSKPFFSKFCQYGQAVNFNTRPLSLFPGAGRVPAVKKCMEMMFVISVFVYALLICRSELVYSTSIYVTLNNEINK